METMQQATVAPATLSTLEGEETDVIHIDTASIPDYVRDVLVAATLDLYRSILRQPGGRAMLDAKTAARKAEQSKKRKELARKHYGNHV